LHDEGKSGIIPHLSCLVRLSASGFFVVPSLCYARLFQIPVVFSYHTHIPVYIPSYLPLWLAPISIQAVWWWIRFTHSLADLTLVTSNAIQEEFHTRGITNVKVWQKAIDADRFHPRHYSESMRRRMKAPHHSTNLTAPKKTSVVEGHTVIQLDKRDEELFSPLLLLYVGRLAAEKRIERIRTVLENTPNSTLCIVGRGPYEDFLRNYFANTSTVFLGELHGAELSQAYASADVFVFPSDSETLGFVVLEAMASEIPVVAANAGGLPNIIDANATTGFLADRDEDYTRFIRQLGEDKQLRKRIASAGRRAAEQWTWNASMAQVCEEHYKTAQKNFDQAWRVRFSRSLKRGLYKLRSSIGIDT
jgi:sulfoquinovosyltransferase